MYIPRDESWALGQGLSVVAAPEMALAEGLYAPPRKAEPPPCTRIPHVSNLRQRGDEDRLQFIDRISGNGEHHSHYMKRLTRAELQASGALRDMDNLPTRDSFHPILNQES